MAEEKKDFSTNLLEKNKALSEFGRNLKACSESLRILTDDSAGFVDKFIAVTGGISAATSVFTEVKGAVDKARDRVHEMMDTSSKLGDVVEESSGKAIESIKNMGNPFKTLAKSVQGLPGTIGGAFGSAKTHVGNFGENVKTTFSSVKNSLKNFKFSNITNGLKALPGHAKASIAGMGTTLTSGVGSMAAGAGKLLSIGLVGGIIAAVAAVAGLVAIFANLMESNEAFRSKVEEAWGKVKEAFQPAIDAFNEFVDTIMGAGDEDGFTPFVQLILDGVTGLIDFIAEAVGFISEILVGIFEGLSSLWEEHGATFIELVKTGWEAISEVVSQVFEFIGAIVSTVFEVLKALWDEYGSYIMEGIMAVWEFISGIVNGAIEFISGFLDLIKGIFTGNGDLIKEGIGKMWDGICGIFQAGIDFVAGIFSAVWGIICEIFAGIRDWFVEKFNAAWEGIKSVFAGVGNFFQGIWTTIKNMFTSIGSAIGDAIGGAFKKVVNSIIGFAEKTINGFISAINLAIKLINLIPGVNIRLLSKLSIPKLANGGLVDAGQMFVAREAGPELVGSFNGSTAVMNNNQIVESVSRGVFEAVSSALAGGGLGGNWSIQVVDSAGRVTSEQIVTALERKNRRDGKTVVALGV